MNYNPPTVMPDSITGVLPTPAVGYRFHPTNEELIINYLKPKMRGDNVEDLLIVAEVNVCRHEPWDLPDQSIIKSDDLVWYFFCPRDFKYSNSRRSNRRTKEGFWKPTGKNVKIKARRTKEQIGTKKTLVFYKKDTPKALRTDWIIHEYECNFDSSQSNQGEYVLCKLKKKSDEKSNKGEPNHCMPSVSDFEAEPSCSITSDFNYQNRSDSPMNSACNESEVSHHVACHIEYQDSNELMPNSSSHLMTSDLKNQYSNELMSDSACDSGGSVRPMASGFEYQWSNDLRVNLAYYGIGNQYSNDLIAVSTYDGSGMCHSVAAGFENQYSNNLLATAACDGSGLHHSVAAGFDNQYSNNLLATSAGDESGLHHSIFKQYSNNLLAASACDESGLHHSVAAGFDNQYSNSLLAASACDGSGSHHSMAFGFENQYCIDLKVDSPYEDGIMASDFEDQVSFVQLNSECGPSVGMPPKFVCQSTYGKGETSCLAADDFENQNHDKESNISASDEGACNPLITAPLDLENRNPREKTDMFTLEDAFVSYSTGSSSENIDADSALTEASPQLWAEIDAFVMLENSLNSALQPSDMGSGTSVCS